MCGKLCRMKWGDSTWETKKILLGSLVVFSLFLSFGPSVLQLTQTAGKYSTLC